MRVSLVDETTGQERGWLECNNEGRVWMCISVLDLMHVQTLPTFLGIPMDFPPTTSIEFQ
jgi:hypothetical protein